MFNAVTPKNLKGTSGGFGAKTDLTYIGHMTISFVLFCVVLLFCLKWTTFCTLSSGIRNDLFNRNILIESLFVSISFLAH